MPEEDLAGSARLPGRASKHEEDQYGSVVLSDGLLESQHILVREL